MRTTIPNIWLAMWVFLLAMVCTAAGQIIYVDDDGPADFTSIQTAIDAAVDGDVVIVADGTYSGTGNKNLDFGGRAITVRSENGPKHCIIDCENSGRGFYFHRSEGAGSVLDGFTIMRGRVTSGGGISNYHSHPTIINCILKDNTATGGYVHGGGGGGMRNRLSNPIIINCAFIGNRGSDGGAMFNYASSHPTIINCTFSDNSASYDAGVIFNDWCEPRLTNSTFKGNSAGRYGGAIVNHACSPTFRNCTFSGNSGSKGGGMYNYGHGVYDKYRNPKLINCTFSGNRAGQGGGVYSYYYRGNTTLENCILWGNRDNGGMDESGQIDKHHQTGTPIINYSCIQGWTGGWGGIGNIGAVPCFADYGYWDANELWVEGDYHLLEDSICINTGDPNFVPEPNEADLDGLPRVIGGRIDMGAYEFNHIPVADAGPNQIVEAQGAWGARVTLDGSCSSDADSTAGTNDDIVSFDWYKVDTCDPNFEDFLASGEIIDCNLPLGEHIIVLEVIDKADAFDTNEVTIIVQDTTPPDFTLSVTPTMLWPANHKMVLITPTWTASDICDDSPEVSLVSITMNEGDEAKGDGHTTLNIQIGDDGAIYLRAERNGSGSGRIYTITYQAVDDSGNAAVVSATVTVPHDQR